MTRSRYQERYERLNWRLSTPECQAARLRRRQAEAYAEVQVRANFPGVGTSAAAQAFANVDPTEVIAFRAQCIQDYIATHDLPLDEAGKEAGNG